MKTLIFAAIFPCDLVTCMIFYYFEFFMSFSGRSFVLNDNDVNTLTLRTPTDIPANFNLTWPVDDGAPGQVLTTDGSGVLSWTVPSAGGITNLNGLTNPNQIFAVSNAGTAPLISSAGSTHTLQIPAASNPGVTAGTISKVDYDNFSNKLSSISAGNGISIPGGSTIISVNAGIGAN
jgi:hypothetical protein